MSKKKDVENSDLTRIEDLSEFLHQKDSDLDSKFDTFTTSDSDDPLSSVLSLDTLEDLDESELPPEFSNAPDESEGQYSNEYSEEAETENFFESTPDSPFESPSLEETSFDKTIFGENSFGSFPLDSHLEVELEEVTLGEEADHPHLEGPLDTHLNHDDDDDDLDKELLDNLYNEPEKKITPQIYTDTSEKFEDIKTFAQNFSYGKAGQFGGNPPYTIIARNIRYLDDVESILDILSEFNLIDDQNRKDTQKTMEFGALIIPQISEYTAIVLAHKLRRFDLDLQVGLSDEVHPSKSGIDNPRGLLKKGNVTQNKSESLKLSDLNISIKDIIISTTSTISGYFVESYIGVQTTFTIIEEAELEKLQFVARAEREKSELFDYGDSEIPTEKIFQDYQNSFELLYADLTMQLKQKAFTQHANALLGLTFQLSPLQFERSSGRINAYQITCSATLAIVSKENS